VFGWTHAYNIPYLLYWLDKEGEKEKETINEPEIDKNVREISNVFLNMLDRKNDK